MAFSLPLPVPHRSLPTFQSISCSEIHFPVHHPSVITVATLWGTALRAARALLCNDATAGPSDPPRGAAGEIATERAACNMQQPHRNLGSPRVFSVDSALGAQISSHPSRHGLAMGLPLLREWLGPLPLPGAAARTCPRRRWLKPVEVGGPNKNSAPSPKPPCRAATNGGPKMDPAANTGIARNQNAGTGNRSSQGARRGALTPTLTRALTRTPTSRNY